MRTIAASLALILGITLLFALDGDSAAGPKHLAVHEWGTFTSMQGPDGVWLEGLHHEEEALPKFVHTMTNTRGEVHEGKGGLWVERVTRKMETPVIYFYTPHPMRVKVDVRFLGGLINQWYPAAASHSYWHEYESDTAAIERGDAPHDVARVQSSFIRWDVDVIPRTGGRLPVPSVKPGDPWQLARRVRAAMVRTHTMDPESEAYLFYRGLGRERINLHVRDSGGGRLLLDNKTGHRINAAFALEIGPAGARSISLGALAPDSALTVAALDERPLRPAGAVVAGLRRRVKAALIAEGLFADEAEAMVATWSRQWFASEGVRVIYVVPRAEIDRMLPIRIDPTPGKLVRAFIGRVEVITDSMQRDIGRALTRGDASRLARLGRFEEPYLRLLAKGRDKQIARLAGRRLKALAK